MMQLAIWWTSQQDCEWIEQAFPDGPAVPQYIRDEFQSRLGRNGRGRLWVHDSLPDCGIDPWPEEAPFARAALHCGGIVIHRDDVHLVCCLPGFITDFGLKAAADAAKEQG